jgi:tetratricopeptide (TPR) repeat protein
MNSILTGNLDIGLARYQDLEQHARRVNNPIQLAWALDGQALVHIIRGQIAEAQKLIEQATSLSEENADHTAIIYNTAYASYVAWQQGEWKEAAALVDQTNEYLSQSMPLVYSLMFGLNWITEVSLAIWKTTRDKTSKKRLEKSLRFGKAFQRSFPISRPGMLRIQANMDWAAGKYTRAIKRWQNSLEQSIALGLPIDEARAQADLGIHSNGELRRKHLTRAKELFDGLYIQPEVAFTNALTESKKPGS